MIGSEERSANTRLFLYEQHAQLDSAHALCLSQLPYERSDACTQDCDISESKYRGCCAPQCPTMRATTALQMKSLIFQSCTHGFVVLDLL